MKKEKKNPAIMVIVLGFLFLLQIKLSAQIDSLKNYNLDEVIISATRSEKNLWNVGRSVSVLSKNDFNNSFYLSPSELLASQEGINIIGAGQNPGSLTNIYMRGSQSNQSVIMIDGLRITDPSSVENSIELSELSLANIQKIELVRGSHSTLYGSSAIGGIINLITEKNMKPGLNADLNLRTGTFGSGTFDLSQNLLLNYTTFDGFYFSGEVYNSNIQGIDATVKNTNAVNFKDYDKDDFKKTDIFSKAGYAANNLDVYITYKRTDQKADIDDGAFSDDDNYVIEFERNLFNLGASYKFDDNFKIVFNGGYTDMKRFTVDDSSLVDNSGTTDHSYFEGTYDGSVLNNEIQANLKFKNVTAVIGGGFYSEKMNNKTFFFSGGDFPFQSDQNFESLDIKADINNIFGHMDFSGTLLSNSLSALSLGLGARYSNHSTFGDEITYEINPSYKFAERSLLYFSFATGFNAPSLYRLFAPDVDFSSGITRGNKNLKPEYSKSLELGLKQAVGKDFNFTLSLYSTTINNYIEYVYMWDNNIPVDELGNDWMRNDFRGDTYINIGDMKNKGIEFTFDFKIDEQITTGGNFTIADSKVEYLKSEIDETHTQGNLVQSFFFGEFVNTDGIENSMIKRSHTVNLFLNFNPAEDLFLRLSAKFVGKKQDLAYDGTLGPYGALGAQDIGDYTLFDLTAKYNILKNLSAGLRIENIFDKEYTEVLGYRTRGRGAYFSLKYSLQ